jgi:hypothetical protein
MVQDYQCKFCSKSFTRERTLSSHMCEKKRRWMNKDDPAGRIGFSVWTDFMKYVSPNTKKVKTVDDFIRSPDYIGFVKFANYLIELRPFESDKFIHWLFKMGVRLGDWQKPGTYQLYVQDAAKKETADRALERTILSMREWGEATGNNWQEFFNKIAPASAMNMVVMGRLSPWIIYSTNAAQALLDRMEPGQIDTVAKHVDTGWWIKKLKNNPEEVNWINTTMQQILNSQD